MLCQSLVMSTTFLLKLLGHPVTWRWRPRHHNTRDLISNTTYTKLDSKTHSRHLRISVYVHRYVYIVTRHSTHTTKNVFFVMFSSVFTNLAKLVFGEVVADLQQRICLSKVESYNDAEACSICNLCMIFQYKLLLTQVHGTMKICYMPHQAQIAPHRLCTSLIAQHAAFVFLR